MNHTVQPGPVRGVVRVPGSKSITHRATLLAAHSDRPVQLAGALDAADTQATRLAMQAMGAQVDGWAFEPRDLHAPGSIDVGNSGTTMRLMIGQAARFAQPTKIDGDASIRRRPNDALAAALTARGATLDRDQAPMQVSGPLRPGPFALPAGVSSQYASAILLAAAFLDSPSTLTMAEPIASRPYLDLTCSVAADFGLELGAPGRLDIQPGACRGPAVYEVEADWSTAAFPLVAGALAGDVTVEGLDAVSPQGDRAVLDRLRSFGADVHGTRVRSSPLEAPEPIDVSATPDMFPALCVLAAAARGTTIFTGGAALRHKESDRIAAMAQGLAQLGIECTERPDGLVVLGGTLRAGTVSGHHDHRIHMAFCLAGLVAEGPVTVTDAEATAISYPGFHADLATLQGGA